ISPSIIGLLSHRSILPFQCLMVVLVRPCDREEQQWPCITSCCIYLISISKNNRFSFVFRFLISGMYILYPLSLICLSGKRKKRNPEAVVLGATRTSFKALLVKSVSISKASPRRPSRLGKGIGPGVRPAEDGPLPLL